MLRASVLVVEFPTRRSWHESPRGHRVVQAASGQIAMAAPTRFLTGTTGARRLGEAPVSRRVYAPSRTERVPVW